MISNKAGIGAKLYLKAFINGNTFTQMREISSQSGGSISGQNNLNAFFGLGTITLIDSLKIVWPSGIIDKYGLIQPNRFLTAVEGQSLTNIEFKENVVPTEFALEQNYQNPFNPVTKIRFEIPLSKGGQRGLYSILKIFDILGKEITTLVNESLKPGTYEVTFNGSNLPSGVYFYRFRAGDFIDTKKLVLFK